MNRFLRISLQAYVVSLLVLPAFADAKKPISRKRPSGPTPVALLICFDDYAHLADLKHPVSSCLKLLGRLVEYGYRVTIVVDPTAKDRVEKAIPKEKSSQVEILTGSSANEVRAAVRKWGAASFPENKPRAPFGLIGFNGHGVRRGGEDMFLSPDNKPGDDAVSITALQEEIGRVPLPVFMIVDTCRNKVPESPVKDVSKMPETVSESDSDERREGQRTGASVALMKRARGSGLQVQVRKGDVTDDAANHGVLTVYATHEDATAIDSGADLMSLLADGLAPVENPKSFEASRLCRLRTPLWEEAAYRTGDLPALAWFNYALSRLPERTENQQTGRLVEGWIDQTMVVATREDSSRYVTPTYSLVGAWGGFAGGLKVERSRAGVAFQRVPGAEKTSEFATGFLDPKRQLQQSIDPVNRRLRIEVMAESETLSAGTQVGISVHPGDHTPGPLGQKNPNLVHFYPGWQRAIPVTIGRVSVLEIPLSWAKQGQRLETVAIATDATNPDVWPQDAKVTIVNMKLVSARGAVVLSKLKSGIAYPPISVLAHAWLADNIVRQNSTFRVASKIDSTDAQTPYLELTKSDEHRGLLSGKGGPIHPSFYVDKKEYVLCLVVDQLEGGDRVDVLVTSAMASPEGGDLLLVEETVEVTPGDLGKLIRLPITRSGFCDYLAITTTASSLRIGRLEFRHKDDLGELEKSGRVGKRVTARPVGFPSK